MLKRKISMDNKETEKFRENSKDLPFFDFCKLELVSLGNGESVGIMHVNKDHLNHVNAVHGGLLFAVSDTLAGMAAFSLGKNCVTLNSSYEYYKMAAEGDLICRNKVIHAGSRVIRTESSIYNQKEELLCGGVFTYYSLGDRDPDD